MTNSIFSSSQGVVSAIAEWDSGRLDPDRMSGHGLERYFHGVAEARYVIRKVFRIVDEQAKSFGLEPLEHQALIQILGSPEPLRVIDLADRLDIAPAFASRLARRLEAEGLLTRMPSVDDRRSTHLIACESARERLAAIDEKVHLHVGHFSRQLTDDERIASLGIFAFYLGVQPHAKGLHALLGLDSEADGRAS